MESHCITGMTRFMFLNNPTGMTVHWQSEDKKSLTLFPKYLGLICIYSPEIQSTFTSCKVLCEKQRSVKPVACVREPVEE